MTLPQTQETSRKISSLISAVRTGDHCLEQASAWGLASKGEAAPSLAGRAGTGEALEVLGEPASCGSHTASWLHRL